MVEQAGERASSGRLVINYQGCHNDLVCVCVCATAERESAMMNSERTQRVGWSPACLPDDDALCRARERG